MHRSLQQRHYFEHEVAASGLPSITFFADKLAISSNYFSDLLPQMTSQNAQQHIHAKLIKKAKERLTATQLSVNENPVTRHFMKLKDLITDQNRALYQRISSQFPIQLKRANDGFWSSNLDDKRVLIHYAQTKHPQAAFAHELLHIETQLNGYRRLRAGVSLNQGVQEQLPFLCEVIDNEFQHYRMYPRFIELGYQPNEFYQGSDALTEQYILYGIEAKGQALTSVMKVYFTLLGAGGTIVADRVLELKEQFRSYDEGAFRERFDAIDKIVAAWSADVGFDAESYIVELMNVLACTDAWISYVPNSTNFPGDGFFTSRAFTLEDLQAVWGTGEGEDL